MPVRRMVTIGATISQYAHLEARKILWGGALWTSGSYANTVGRYASEETIRKYVKNQGGAYKKLYEKQLDFEFQHRYPAP